MSRVNRINLDGRVYCRVGLLLWPADDILPEEHVTLLADVEPIMSAARDNRALPWEPVPAELSTIDSEVP